jgi:hypothetical protein
MSLDLVIMALGGDSISISDRTASAFTVSPTNAAAVYTLQNDGDIEATTGTNTISDVGDWINPRGAAGNTYEARATVTSGSLSSGTTGSWLALGTTRTWTLQAVPGVGVLQAVFTLEIRRASDAIVVDSATITLEAESAV